MKPWKNLTKWVKKGHQCHSPKRVTQCHKWQHTNPYQNTCTRNRGTTPWVSVGEELAHPQEQLHCKQHQATRTTPSHCQQANHDINQITPYKLTLPPLHPTYMQCRPPVMVWAALFQRSDLAASTHKVSWHQTNWVWYPELCATFLVPRDHRKVAYFFLFAQDHSTRGPTIL